jgi:acyl-CoA synthetase (AMP-forming)/AMP-acid ligase II
LSDVLEQHARIRPQALAAVCGGSRISWQQMDTRGQTLAGELSKAGVGTGDRVLWWGQNCHRLLEILFAASKLEAVVCPANWRQTAQELAFVLDDCAARAVIWQAEEIGDVIRAVRGHGKDDALWIQHDGTGPNSYEARLSAAPPHGAHLDRPADANTAVLMMYTAAFDGRPNGALLSDRALLAQSTTVRLLEGLGERTVYLNSGPMFHIGGLRRTVAVAHGGGLNVFCRRVDAGELCRLIDAEQCTHAFLQTPTMAQMVRANSDGLFNLKSLRSAGGPEGWNDMVTVADPQVSSGYGQTEVAGVVTFNYPGLSSIGALPGPLARVEVHTPSGASVAAGEIGEIVVRGPVVMNGYHNRPELNAVRARGGWHHTNDLGRLENDGSISFIAPLQRIIKSAAENIYPAEVESILLAHPAVTEAAVLGVPDAHWGQRVKAVIVAERDVTADDLLAFCRTRLAGYKCPRLFEFVDSLPRNGGLLDRDLLDTDHGGAGYPGTATT